MGRRCLIVDDNPGFLKAARDLLGRQGVEIVAVASTSAEALALLAELRPELVLVDVDLGPESGLELARRIVAGDVPAQVILISAYAETDLHELIETSPAVGFLSKGALSGAAIDALLSASPDT